MALKVHDNGFVEIKTKKDAEEALKRFRDLKIEIDETKADSGLVELEQDAMAYKAGLQNYMIRHKVEQMQGRGFHGTLVKGAKSKRWIATDSDLTGEEPKGTLSLKAIVEKKLGDVTKKGPGRRLWRKITKSIVDIEGLEEAVDSELLTTEEIAPAYIETEGTPYLRVYEETENEDD